MAIEAQFGGGECRDCLEPIAVGDQIVPKEIDGRRLWVHDECHARPRRSVEVCTECWLEKPCECEDG